MKRGRSTGNPTKAQQARFDAIKEHGCVVCLHRGLGFVPAEIHHMTIGGLHGQKRRGHDFTVGLCPWHHRGVTPCGFGEVGAEKWWFGVSYAKDPRAFRIEYPDSLLLEMQNDLIASGEIRWNITERGKAMLRGEE